MFCYVILRLSLSRPPYLGGVMASVIVAFWLFFCEHCLLFWFVVTCCVEQNAFRCRVALRVWERLGPGY